MVYPNNNEEKQTCSFKGYKSIWEPYKRALWEDGFPDICYVEHTFHSAYLAARKEAGDAIHHVPFRLGEMNFFVTIVSPYIVERPRRYRKHVKKEVTDEEIDEL